MKTLVENTHHTGAIDSPYDLRDHKYHRLQHVLGGAPAPFDWDKGYDVETVLASVIPGFTLPTEDQDESDSCWGQFVRYGFELAKASKEKLFTRLSAHDPYCQVYYPTGGTTMLDGAKQAVQIGIKTEAAVPSYLPDGSVTERFMEDKTFSNSTPLAPKFAEYGFAFPTTDIETIASAMRDNLFAGIQITGYNNGTWRSTFPQPNRVGEAWSHFLLCGKAKRINGQKYIGVKNSWGNIGEQGWQWLSEAHFKGLVAKAVVFYDKSIYTYQPTLLQTSPTWLVKFLNFFTNYFTTPISSGV